MRSLLVACVLFCSVHTVFAQQTVGLFEYDEQLSWNGYTLLASMTSESAYLLDNCGEVVHSWPCSTRPGLMTYLMNDGSLLRTGNVSSLVFSGGGIGGLIERIDWDGNVVWQTEFADTQLHQHHDIEALPNGNILVICWGKIEASEALALGRNATILDMQNGLWAPEIFEIEPFGTDGANVVWHWRMRDHVIQDVDGALPNFGVVADHPELMDINYILNNNNSQADWLHCNSIDYNEELDQILISARSSSEIFILDHSTTTAEAASHSGGDYGKGGDLLYRFGNPTVYDRGNQVGSQQLFVQHDATWIPNGYPGEGSIILFNNLGGGNQLSSINVLTPPQDSPGFYSDPGADAYGPSDFDWTYIDPDFFSQNISGTQRLPNGNTLICEGRSGQIFEVTQDGQTVWDYISPIAQGDIILSYNQQVQNNNVFRALRYATDHPAFIGRDLTPQGPLELNAPASNCVISSTTDDLLSDLRVQTTESGFFLSREENSPLQLELFDVQGRLISQTNWNTVSIELEAPSPAIYIIRIVDGREMGSIKLVHQF